MQTSKYLGKGKFGMYRGIFHRCNTFYEHNEFLAILEENEYDEEKFQEIISTVPQHKKCSDCRYHSTVITTDFIPSSQIKVTGDVKRNSGLTNLGIMMLIVGAVALFLLLGIIFYSHCVLGPSSTVFENIAQRCGEPMSLIDTNLANYISAISVYLVASAIMAERQSSNLAKITALFSALASIGVFWVNLNA